MKVKVFDIFWGQQIIAYEYVEIYLYLVHKLQLHLFGTCRSKESRLCRLYWYIEINLRMKGQLIGVIIGTNQAIAQISREFTCSRIFTFLYGGPVIQVDPGSHWWNFLSFGWGWTWIKSFFISNYLLNTSRTIVVPLWMDMKSFHCCRAIP